MEKINKIIEASINALYDAMFSGKITNHKDLIEIGYYVRSVRSDLLSEKNNPIAAMNEPENISIKSEV